MFILITKQGDYLIQHVQLHDFPVPHIDLVTVSPDVDLDLEVIKRN